MLLLGLMSLLVKCWRSVVPMGTVPVPTHSAMQIAPENPSHPENRPPIWDACPQQAGYLPLMRRSRAGQLLSEARLAVPFYPP